MIDRRRSVQCFIIYSVMRLNLTDINVYVMNYDVPVKKSFHHRRCTLEPNLYKDGE